MAIKSRVTLTTQTCIKCGITRPATSEFFPRRKGAILRNECKECNSEYHRSWAEDNRERSREIKTKYAKANPEKHRGDPEKDNLRSKRWRSKNPRQLAFLSRRWHLKTKYGLSIEDYHSKLAEQNGKCAICGTDKTGKHDNFHVDHDHKTGIVRSLLCSGCNHIVGTLEGKADLLELSKNYIERYTYHDYSI